MKRTALVAIVCLVLLCSGGGWFLYCSGFFEACHSVDSLRQYISGFAPYSHLCFFLIQFLSVVLAPIPSNISAAAGGLLFGTLPSFLLTASAVAAGSLVVFLLARIIGRPFADKLVSRKISEKYLDLINDRADLFLLLAFLFPFFPDDVLCILAGLTKISLGRFTLLVVLARPWGLLFASALGGASLSFSLWEIVIMGVVGITLFVLGMKYGNLLRDRMIVYLRKKGKNVK